MARARGSRSAIEMDDLPEEIRSEIMRHASPKDIRQLAQASQSMNRSVNLERAYRQRRWIIPNGWEVVSNCPAFNTNDRPFKLYQQEGSWTRVVKAPQKVSFISIVLKPRGSNNRREYKHFFLTPERGFHRTRVRAFKSDSTMHEVAAELYYDLLVPVSQHFCYMENMKEVVEAISSQDCS